MRPLPCPTSYSQTGLHIHPCNLPPFDFTSSSYSSNANGYRKKEEGIERMTSCQINPRRQAISMIRKPGSVLFVSESNTFRSVIMEAGMKLCDRVETAWITIMEQKHHKSAAQVQQKVLKNQTDLWENFCKRSHTCSFVPDQGEVGSIKTVNIVNGECKVRSTHQLIIVLETI